LLNKHLVAYGASTVRKAVVAIWDGRAEPVNHTEHDNYESYSWEDWTKLRPVEGDRLVRTVGGAFVAPQVVKMIDFKSMPRRGLTCNRSNICKRDGWRCQYCGCKVTGETMTLDHVTPRCQGGESVWENLVASCYDCNQRKKGRTPRQANMVLLQKPVKPEWTPDFAVHAPKFTSWQKFLDFSYWTVPLKT
jgi:5-methylcytosine-specific restriction endonuclease McrA